ncbi:MAG: Asp-tRNA(Asn)/Glu-tRNA(Gln) amidotransferase subunit GatB [Planctomycetes bacterium]|nr:Asp-tRNA(Asn)/Glu-tRNA(Gln) amidotransferase subunit GatB [Planctomycetota bacterium]
MATASKVEYEPVIGLEVHVQLKTATKMFCGCAVQFGVPANSLTCPVCLGLPGALPMVNRQAVEYGIRIGLALNCQIAHRIKFDRKNYFYPDLPKGYQISQYDEPLCFDGELQLPIHDTSGQPKICRITRAHLEEDAGKSIHMDGSTLVDLNRAGTPLVEIVGGPDLRSPEEAYVYLNTLKRNLSYLGVSDLSMEKGSLRCDANVSIRPKGQEKFGVRSEIKNLNSFRAVRAALEHEIKRHTEVLEGGGSLSQQTLLWDEEKLETRPMRSKEEATDYRFFPEPDLATFDVPREWVEKVRATLPEMPEKRLLRFLDDYKLSEQDAVYLVGDKALAEFYEAAIKLMDEPKKVAAWVVGEVTRELNDRNIGIEELQVSPAELIELIKLLDAGKLNNITAKEVFHGMAEEGAGALETAKKLNKLIEQDEGAMDAAIAEVIEEFKDKAVADFKNGEQKALGFLIGQCMRKLKGKANPKELGPKIAKAING